jgi:hypothetical protein
MTFVPATNRRPIPASVSVRLAVISLKAEWKPNCKNKTFYNYKF